MLLDTFFQILIYHGAQVAEWRKAGYHEQEEYQYFKEFLEAPKREAMMLLMDRFPCLDSLIVMKVDLRQDF